MGAMVLPGKAAESPPQRMILLPMCVPQPQHTTQGGEGQLGWLGSNGDMDFLPS